MQQSVIECRLGCTLKHHGRRDHGGDKGEEGGATMSLFECITGTPCIKVFLFLPDGERYVVSEFVNVCERVDA
jgi:hypothetical protein